MSSRKQQKAEARERRLAAQREREEREGRRRIVRLAGAGAVVVAAIVAIVLVAGGGEDSDSGQATGGAGVAGASETRSLYDGIPQDGTTLGDPDAELVLTEYADLQCPFCAEYATAVLPELIEEYVRPGRLRLDLRLLRFIGPDSDRGAQAAFEAAEHDRMWQFVDLWYRNQGPEQSGYGTDDFIAGLAEAARVPEDAAVEAANTGTNSRAIEQAEQEAQIQGIDSTPSFLVGPEAGRGQRLEVDALTFDAFRRALEPLLE